MSVLYFRDKHGVLKPVPAIVGRSAYQIAVKNGFAGTEKQWLESLKGAPGHTPVKGVDYMDGHTPVKGIDYFDGRDGVDGYTPIKGVDYFDGKDGRDGVDGYTPVKGVDYTDGKDGQDGQDGYTPVKDKDYFDGKDGHTPERGKDYWTEDDIAAIKQYVSGEIIGAEVVSVKVDRALQGADAGKFLSVDLGAYITVPADVLPVGVEIEIFRNTSDGVRIGADLGVWFAVPGNAVLVSSYQDISEQYASVVLKQIAANVWSIQGAVA